MDSTYRLPQESPAVKGRPVLQVMDWAVRHGLLLASETELPLGEDYLDEGESEPFEREAQHG